MTRSAYTIRVPATTANLGPGFDCLALSLNLWNQATFILEGKGVKVEINGEGKGILCEDEKNLIAKTTLHFFSLLGAEKPQRLRIICDNQIPLSSGLGSSAAAHLLGLLGANAILGNPLTSKAILNQATQLEGHPDNASAALFGGLVVSVCRDSEVFTRRFELPELKVVLIIPEIHFPTAVSRAALPKMIPLADAVFNIGNTALVVEALKSGDLQLLSQVMVDRLHQPYRIKLIKGAERALQVAMQNGAACGALSGAGPGIICFSEDQEKTALAMQEVFTAQNVVNRAYCLTTTNQGAYFLP